MSNPITIASAKEDDLLFRSLTASERLGELFSHDLEFESRNIGIDLSGLLGTSMTVKLETEDGYKRYFNGIVCEAEQTGVDKIDDLVYASYHVQLVPRPWYLGSIHDCRIFKNQSAVDIAKAVLGDVGYSDIKTRLSGSYDKRDYCVQYREDGLNFIDRLLQQEGIYYYFEHSDDKHVMVLADGVGAHDPAERFQSVPLADSTQGVLDSKATISDWVSLRGVDASKVRLTDYDPLKPKASLLAKGSHDGHGADGIEVFDYPGTHLDKGRGEHLAQVRAEALSASRSRYLGDTDACSVTIGALFKLQNHPRSELNQEYLVTATAMQLVAPGYASGSGPAGPRFHCRFEALESKQPYRSMATARKPVVPGLQTGVVTGSKDDEDIAVDKHGRVQVLFHWNMPAKERSDCSCPVRVASMWAGKRWGAVSWPRVGQEVVVSFIEGDPDRPLIIGSVYNGANMPPWELPANKTQSGVKSRSLLGGTEQFNELRFEDKKGSEDFFMHAEKDMHESVENDHEVSIGRDEKIKIGRDQSLQVGRDQTVQIDHDHSEKVGHDESLDVGRDQALTVGRHQTEDVGKNQTKEVGKDRSVTVKDNETVAIGKNQTMTVDGDQSLTVKGNQATVVKGERSLKVTGDQAIRLKDDQKTGISENDKLTVGKDRKVCVGQKYSLKAKKEIKLNCGKASITLKPSGEIEIKGTSIKINGQQAVSIDCMTYSLDADTKVKIKAGARAEFKGASVSVKGTANTGVSGAMVFVG